MATHSRGVFILDDASAIQELAAAAAKPMHLFAMRTATRFATKTTKTGALGDAIFRGANPAYGAIIRYHLASKPSAETAVHLEVRDSAGNVVRTLRNVPREAGINTTAWNLTYESPRQRRPGGAAGGDDDSFWGPPSGPRVLPGRYTVRLVVGSQQEEQSVMVRLDPTVQVSAADLREQLTLSLQLRDLQSVVNDTLRALDGRKAELEVRKRAADAIPDNGGKAVAEQLAAELKDINALLDALVKPSIAPYWSEGPRIADRVGNLLRNIEMLNAAPTGPQKTLSLELAAELREAMDVVARRLNRLGITM